MSFLHHAALVVVAAVVTYALVPMTRAIGLKIGAVAQPGGRNVHEGVIPRIGGVAIYAGMLAAVAVQWAGETWLGWGAVLVGGPSSKVNMLGVVAGLTLVFVVGLIDDIVTLKPGTKFVGQLLAAGVMVASGLEIARVGNPFTDSFQNLGLLSFPVTMIYLVAFANVINLIDGMDGLAGGVSAIAATSLLVLAAQGNRYDAAVFAAALIGACIAFLRYNFHPATVFMGDSGALLLGFVLATVSLLGVMKTTAAIALAVPLLVVGVPIFDTASAIVRRVRHNRPIQEADKGHIHHRLLGRGFGQRQTVLIIYAWSGALAIGGYGVRYAPPTLRLVAFAVLVALSALMAYWLNLYEVARHHVDEGGESGAGEER